MSRRKTFVDDENDWETTCKIRFAGGLVITVKTTPWEFHDLLEAIAKGDQVAESVVSNATNKTPPLWNAD